MRSHEGWEGNFPTRQEDDLEEAIAKGRTQGREKEAEAYRKKDGKEFKILRRIIPGGRLWMRGGMRDADGSGEYPPATSLRSPDGWLELVLPPAKK